MARERGFAGPAAPEAQIERSLAFTHCTPPPARALDLGSGAGLPGLVLALAWPCSQWYLLDCSQKRTAWLREAVLALGLEQRCEVVQGRAEVAARSPLRGSFQLVTARGLAPAAPTAECAAAFLATGGTLLVAEPPLPPTPASALTQASEPVPSGDRGHSARWATAGLAKLGLRLETTTVVGTGAGPVTLSRLSAHEPCPEKYPRRVGVPYKRPLF
jgi:16S rRNA (guanine527-N7)-methyltransferase